MARPNNDFLRWADIENVVMDYHAGRVVSKYMTSEDCKLVRSEIEAVLHELEYIPAADVVEVVHGEWMERRRRLDWCDDDVDIVYECSICNSINIGESQYCPECGAKMDGGKA